MISHSIQERKSTLSPCLALFVLLFIQHTRLSTRQGLGHLVQGFMNRVAAMLSYRCFYLSDTLAHLGRISKHIIITFWGFFCLSFFVIKLFLPASFFLPMSCFNCNKKKKKRRLTLSCYLVIFILFLA